MILKRRFVIYAEGKIGPYSSKTANCAIRYFPEQVVCVIDSTKKNGKLEEFIGIGKGIPIVGNFREALEFKPNTFLVGSAPVGGSPDRLMIETVKEAVCNKIKVVNGLHHFFSEMPEIAALAQENQVEINDLRKIASPLRVAQNKWKEIRAKVVLTVGGDCNSGKLSTTYELYQSFRELNLPSGFIGTGQTGILLAGKGVPADAVVSDFLPGAVESEVAGSDEKGNDFIFVEGQGALTHPAYSAVTMGILHGAMPDAMIFCFDPGREFDDWGNPVPDLKQMLVFHEQAVNFFKKSKVVGLSVITRDIASESDARKLIQKFESETGLPANDPYRFGCRNLVESLLRFFDVKSRS